MRCRGKIVKVRVCYACQRVRAIKNVVILTEYVSHTPPVNVNILYVNMHYTHIIISLREDLNPVESLPLGGRNVRASLWAGGLEVQPSGAKVKGNKTVFTCTFCARRLSALWFW